MKCKNCGCGLEHYHYIKKNGTSDYWRHRYTKQIEFKGTVCQEHNCNEPVPEKKGGHE